MLINFTVGNFRSFKEKRTLSLEAANIKEYADSVISQDEKQVLPLAALYGANSSGKSNLLNALKVFVDMVRNSFTKMNSNDRFQIEPFMLDGVSAAKPSFFEIEIISNTTKNYYRYGFEATAEAVVAEWLYKRTPKKELCLFLRASNSIEPTKIFAEGKGIENRVRPNSLFLSVCDSFNGQIAHDITSTINPILVTSAVRHEEVYEATKMLHWNMEQSYLNHISEMFRNLDVGFSYFEIPHDETLAKAVKAFTYHNKYDAEGNIVGKVRFNMLAHESEGTNKLFDMLFVILFSLQHGSLLVFDEFDCKLHPLITAYIIKMFNDPKFNTAHGQLIFATHDSNLLSAKCLRRDEVWFVEKDKTEASDLYSLVEFKDADGVKVRNDRSFEKDYIKGRYGAIPYVNYNW